MAKKNTYYSCATLPIRVEERRFYHLRIDLILNDVPFEQVDTIIYDAQTNKATSVSENLLSAMRKKDKEFLRTSIKEALRCIGTTECDIAEFQFGW